MLEILPEGPEHGPEIERLLDLSFGPDRHRKVSYRYRPGIPPIASLCLVAREDGERIVGAIRHWPVLLGDRPALLLGPLAIDPDRQGRGVGRTLIRASLAAAEAMGHRLVFLVGDPAYYARHGFRPVPPAIVMPDEDPARVQYVTLAGTGVSPESGELLRADRASVAAPRPPGAERTHGSGRPTGETNRSRPITLAAAGRSSVW